MDRVTRKDVLLPILPGITHAELGSLPVPHEFAHAGAVMVASQVGVKILEALDRIVVR